MAKNIFALLQGLFIQGNIPRYASELESLFNPFDTLILYNC